MSPKKPVKHRKINPFPRLKAPKNFEILAHGSQEKPKVFIETPEVVNHPAHYGGEANPYEAIKVMEARLTPQELVGALKFQVYTYNDRARQKGHELEDYEKALWYQNRLVEYIKRLESPR
jgi:uncharacterized protein DUF3310